MERGRKSPKPDVNSLTKPERTKKTQNNTNKSLSPEQLKTQLEQNLSQKIATPPPVETPLIESEKQTTEAPDSAGKNRFQKFGIRVLPMDSKDQQPPVATRSPKSAELSQNDNNINQERQENGIPEGVDEVDKTKQQNGDVVKDEAPPVKRREKTRSIPDIPPMETFERQNSLNGSGIKRDKAGIPQEIPEHMLQAAVAARKNRKSQEILETPEIIEAEVKTPKKQKGKAPAPPPTTTTSSQLEDLSPTATKLNFTDNLDEISTLQEEEKEVKKPVDETPEEPAVIPPETEAKEYCSDSDMETDNQSSVNTIELNSSDITIHHAEQNAEIKGRKTASTGDLSKIQKENKSNSGTLERAQSLDITDSGIPTLNKKRKATKDDLDSKLSSDESLYENPGVKIKEPRLSLALDGLDTFQRNRLKKSSEWGNLEDVILNLDKVEAEDSGDEAKPEFTDAKAPIKFDFGVKDDVPFLGNNEEIKNTIWPKLNDDGADDTINVEKIAIKPQIVDKKDKVLKKAEDVNNVSVQNVVWPTEQIDSIEINSSDLGVVELQKKLEGSPENTEKHFSLKDTFQEKLNSKLSETADGSANKDELNVSTIYTKPTNGESNFVYHPGKSSQNFIFAEKYASNNDCYDFPKYDTNISDDIKVSRHSLGSLERPKSDVLKSVNKLKMQNLIASDQGGVSNITVTESTKKPEEPTYDLSTASELYTTANDLTLTLQDEKPESDQYASSEIKNITITDISDSKYSEGPSSLTIDTSSDGPDSIKSNTLTFVTEIQVTTPPGCETPKPEEPIRKLAEMKFTTSSYETPPRSPEKRISQIELLRSNFEKSPSKSRIPVATKIDFKMSPERKEDEEIVEIISTNSNVHHSTPLVSNQKVSSIKVPLNSNSNSRNVTVTSIRTSSKIPSGLSGLSGLSGYAGSSGKDKPPVPARPDAETHHERNGTAESSFKQWVFNPNENSVTNIVVNNNKDSHK